VSMAIELIEEESLRAPRRRKGNESRRLVDVAFSSQEDLGFTANNSHLYHRHRRFAAAWVGMPTTLALVFRTASSFVRCWKERLKVLAKCTKPSTPQPFPPFEIVERD